MVARLRRSFALGLLADQLSGMVGIWHLNGRPLDSAVLSSPNASLRHRGSDGEGQRVHGPVAFACRHRGITQEDIGERQPLPGRSGVTLVMDGRLDHREELLPLLNLPGQRCDLRVSRLRGLAGRICRAPERCFALAIFDPSRQRLVLVRHAIGMRTLYYFRSDCLFTFASEICDTVTSEYDVTRAQCEEDVRALLGELASQGLVEVRDDG